MNTELSFVEDAEGALHRLVHKGVRAYNATLFAGHPEGQDLAIALRQAGSVEPVGGLVGRTSGGWLFVELLFVPEACRGQGLATRLIAMAEAEAIRRGCHSAWIDTLNERARDLYERLGYRVFGELENYPVGSSRFFLRKAL
jgi:ribosomal protein S18 acetylase RimI-like enzyme